MRHRFFILPMLMASLGLLNTTPSNAMLPEIHFASVQEGVRELAIVDDFVSRLSPFDRAARLKVSQDVSQAEYLKFTGQQVLEWSDDLKAQIQTAFTSLAPSLAALKLPKVDSLLLIRTTGREEGGAAYTRGRCIILPDTHTLQNGKDLPGLLAHELFHVMSRADPKFRDRLYEVIGFEACPEVVLPPALASRLITNPDAPVAAHAITVTVDGEKKKVVPVLLSSVRTYPEGSDEEFFQFLSVRFWPLGGDGASVPATPLSLSQFEGFYEQVGRNTDYIIHPEEILAENFRLLVSGSTKISSPEILEKIRTALLKAEE